MKRSRLHLIYGIGIGAAAIVYFLLLSLLGLHENPFFSAVNILFYGIGFFLLITKFKERTEGIFKYQEGFWAMFRAGIIATLIITGFFLLYITELNDGFLQEMLTMWKEDHNVKPGTVILGLALMGFSTSLVLSLAYMQLFKRSWNTREGKKHTL